MALQVRPWVGAGVAEQQGNAWPGLTKDKRYEVNHAIGQLTAAHIFGPMGGIATLQHLPGGWRIDRQNAPGNFVNISVQKNDADNPSTVASVFVPGAFNVAPPPGGANARHAHDARTAELQRKTRNGLEESLDSYESAGGNRFQITRFEVWGNFSA